MRFLKVSQCRKTRKRGPFGLFETSVCCKISKNLKGGPFGDKKNLKIFFKNSKKRKMRVLKVSQCRKTRKRGPFGLFETSVCCKISKNLKGDRLATKKNSKKKSHSVEKSSKGGPCSPVRFCILR